MAARLATDLDGLPDRSPPPRRGRTRPDLTVRLDHVLRDGSQPLGVALARALSTLPGSTPSHNETDALASFTELLVAGRRREIASVVANLHMRGIAPAELLLELVTPAARFVGDLWVEDLCSFAEVTLACGELDHVLRACVDRLPGAQGSERPRWVLLCTMGGETHTLGVNVLDPLLRARGWCVAHVPPDAQVVARHLRTRHVSAVGISIGSERHVPAARELIGHVRRQGTPFTRIAVGGPLAHVDLSVRDRVGADAVSANARGFMALLGPTLDA